MTTRPTLEIARDLALQKVGRNVVNFQKMEAMLKFILTFASLHGPMSGLAKVVAQKTAEVAKEPMGNLVVKAASAIHGDRKSTQQPPTKVAEAWFSYSIKIGETKEDAREWRKLMKAVVVERNELIHQMLATFNPNSIDSCESLCVELDKQRGRIIRAYEHLESIVIAIRESHRDLAKDVDGMVTQRSSQDPSEGF